MADKVAKERTSITIDPALLAEGRAVAAGIDESFSALVELALRAYLPLVVVPTAEAPASEA